MFEDKIDWDSPYLHRWLGNITRDSTKRTYKSYFRTYAEFTKLNAEEMIKEALEDNRKDVMDRTDVLKQRMIGFYDYVLKEAPRKSGPNGDVVGKGRDPKTANTSVNAIRGFYATFDLCVKMKGASRLPTPRVMNKRLILNNMQVKNLLDHAPTMRDRAIILTLFQGGMDISTLCDLKYKDISTALKESPPVKIDLYRQKAGTEYFTFLGRDAVGAIKAYLSDVKSKGLTLEHNDPLFVKLSNKAMSKEGVTDNLIQVMLKEVAHKSGIIDGENNGSSFNIAGAHCLRESFGSIMANKGVPDNIIDFWLGHKIGEMAEAYKRVQSDELKWIYSEMEPFLSVSTNGQDVTKLKTEFSESMAALALKNADLENRLAALIAGNEYIKKSNEEDKKAWGLKLKEIEENQERMGELIRKAVELEMERRKA